MKLKALSLADVEQVRLWRNSQIELLRTPFLLTQEQQEQFYYDVVCNRQANARYWGLWVEEIDNIGYGDFLAPIFIGMCGLENIQWENRLAEISLLLNPELPMKEYGPEALDLVLDQAFNSLNLENVFTEVYNCSPLVPFWLKAARKHAADVVILPDRKHYAGDYYDSYYINFNKGAYAEDENTFVEPSPADDSLS